MNALSLIEAANGRALSKRKMANARSVAAALDQYGERVGLFQPHRLVLYLGQLAHESTGFQHDKEIWGPTPAQKRYEGRADLGNVQPGDGKKFAGHGPIQVTGRANHAAFRDWCRKVIGTCPDFEEHPEKINTDPWEGLTGIWYWSTRSLNRYADSGDIEMITTKINGGLNGYQDRIDWTVKFSLARLGYAPDDVRGFQKAAGIGVDGIAGPRTRAALHKALVALSRPHERTNDVQDAPVVQDKPVVPPKVKAVIDDAAGDGRISMTEVGAACSGVAGTAAAAKEALDAVKETGSSLVSLGPWVLLAGVIVGFAGYIIYERRRKRSQAKAAKAEVPA